MSNNNPVEDLRRQYPTILTTAHVAEMREYLEAPQQHQDQNGE